MTLRQTLTSALVATLLVAPGCGRRDYILGQEDAGPRDAQVDAHTIRQDTGCDPGATGTGCDTRFNPLDCETLGRSIFVADANLQRILRFTPETGEFHDDVRMGCNFTPYSLAVSRDANAWAYDVFGHLRSVNLATGTCGGDLEDSFSYESPLMASRATLAYVSDGPDVETEQLLSMRMSEGRGIMLSPMDTAAREVRIGPDLVGHTQLSEMVGTGDGVLWVFRIVSESMRVIDRIDQATGATLESYDISAMGPAIWPSDGSWAHAIAFWGGRFYLFLQPNGEPSTSIYRFTPPTPSSPSQIETIEMNTGYRISGAATSTCAPVDIF